MSLHVRRGDFLWATGHQRLFNPLGRECYEDAARRVIERIGSDVRFVVSPTIRNGVRRVSTCRRRWRSSQDRSSATTTTANRCRCSDHHVIAKSTFSWWRAWLGEARGKADGEVQRQVVAPREYYTEPALNAQVGIYPDRWTVI